MKYNRSADWPALAMGRDILEMSGVAIGSDGTVFTLDRGGRAWKDRDAPGYLEKPVISRWHPDGEFLGAFGADLFVMPHGIHIDSDEHVWVTDVGRHQVLKMNSNGEVLLILGRERFSGSTNDTFALPTGVVTASDGCIFVSDGYGNARIAKFSAEGMFLQQWGSRGIENGEFKLPHAIAMDPKGDLFVADRENSRIQMFDCSGNHLETWQGKEIGKPFSVAASATHLFAADCGFPKERRAGLVVVDRKTAEVSRFGEYGSTRGGMLGPHDITLAPDGSVYIADAGARLHKFVL